MMSKYVDPDTTHKEKAEIETTLWEALTPDERQRKYAGYRYRYIKTFFLTESARSIEMRRALLSAGTLADSLWLHVDARRITLSTAYDIIKIARRQTKDPAAQLVIVEDTLSRYLTTGRLKAQSKKKPKSYAYGNQVANSIIDYMSEQIDDRDDIEKLAKTIRLDVHALFEEYRQKTRTLNARSKNRAAFADHPRVTRRRVQNAFTTLGMSIPKPAEEIDLAVASRKKRQLARKYHPDLAGNEDLRDAYEAVIDAYQTIEQYKEENHV